ncbi:MAG: HPF/RaiA family ribosome-associated protein [Pseudomonadota bacterium]|nr:HPF/RaiA family ribosome-associated protein [Pseudomonadota bacterium]
MLVQFNPGNDTQAREPLAQWAEEVVNHALRRFAEHITRVEVHVSDDNGGKAGADDKRCTMEARITGHPPLAVTNHASAMRAAITGAADKLQRSIDHTLGRLDRR